MNYRSKSNDCKSFYYLRSKFRYNVSQIRIKNLLNWKDKHGSFKTLNDVLEVDGLGVKVLEKSAKIS